MGLFGNKKKDTGAASGGGKKHAEVGTTIKVQNYNVVVDKQIAEGNFLPPNKKSSKEYYTYEIGRPAFDHDVGIDVYTVHCLHCV